MLRLIVYIAISLVSQSLGASGVLKKFPKGLQDIDFKLPTGYDFHLNSDSSFKDNLFVLHPFGYEKRAVINKRYSDMSLPITSVMTIIWHEPFKRDDPRWLPANINSDQVRVAKVHQHPFSDEAILLELEQGMPNGDIALKIVCIFGTDEQLSFIVAILPAKKRHRLWLPLYDTVVYASHKPPPPS